MLEMAELIPEEVISHVMTFLGVSDRKSASMVCQSWYRASRHPKLIADRLFRFHCWSELDAALPAIQRQNCANVVLETIDNSLATRSRIADASSYAFTGIRSLTLAGCDITEVVFTTILSGCKSLEMLDISRCNALFMTGQLLSKETDVEQLKSSLANVRDLRLASIRYLSDASFNRLMLVCSSITHLSIAGNHIVFHSDAYFAGKERASSTVLTFTNLLLYIIQNSARLLCLDFSRTSLGDDHLAAIAKTMGLKLQEIRLSHCMELTTDGIQSLARLQPALQSLDISECVAIKDSGLEHICSGLADLRQLNVAKCRQITDSSVCKLRNLRQLTKLDMNACYTVTSRGVGLGLCSQSAPLRHLTSLSLACCSSVRDGFVVEMSACLPSLTQLDLGSCGVGNTGLYAICARLTGLRTLRLAWCQDITDYGLLGVRDPGNNHEAHCHDDDDIGLCRCTRQKHYPPIFNPPKAAVQPIAPKKPPPTLDFELRPITNLKKLRTLDLTSCHKLTDASLSKVMSFPELRSLHLSLCPALTDVTLLAIAAGVPSIEELHLAQCQRITDKGVIRLTERLYRLVHLNISSCDNLTNRTLEALFNNVKGLHCLDVSLCSGITSAAVDMLEHNLGRLVSVQKRLVGAKA